MTTVNEPPIRLVAIDDDAGIFEVIRAALAGDGLEMSTATDPEEGLNLVRRTHPDVVLLDLTMPKMSGMEVLERIVATDPDVDVILMTGNFSTESAVEAIQKGACDYLEKPLSIETLRQRVGRPIAEARRRREVLRLDRQLVNNFRFEGMIGRSPLMLTVFRRIRRVAPYSQTVLITGATGTGKELVARSLHTLGPAASGRFVVCNCAAVVETLFESELFGYVRGAFTGAAQDKAGLFEYANGGLLFLDEIGEIPLATQAKLLRVLQTQEFQRVGSPAIRKVNVRIVAATNCDLGRLLAERQFREDLYYRISTVEIKLPRLAERKEDLPLLQRHFLERFAAHYNKPIRGMTRRAQAILSRHSWPGNVRELENVLSHACMMVEGELIDVHDFPEHLRSPSAEPAAGDDELLPLDELERRHVRRVLERVGGNKVQAAAILGISRATLYRVLADNDRAQG